MANNSHAALPVVASGAAAGVDVRLFAPPFTVRFVGATSDAFRVDASGDNTGWVEGTERAITANDAGEVCFTIAEDANYLRVYTTAGNAGATATASVTAEPLTANKPSVVLSVNNDATPGAWGDCRTVGGPRTILYEGVSGDEVYLEGSDDGATNPFQVYPASGTTGRTGATWAAQIEKLPNYTRVVRPQGTTGARCVVVGPNNATGGATGDLVNGGQAGTVIVGSTDGITVLGSNTATATTIRAGTDIALAAGGAGSGSVSVSTAGTGDVSIVSADDVQITANDALGLTAGASGLLITSAGGTGLGGAPNASALLDLQSTTKGFGHVAMTTAQRIAIGSPRAGLEVWDTDIDALCQYDGTQWVYPLVVFATNDNLPSIADTGTTVAIANFTNPAVANVGSAFNITTGVFTVPFTGNYDITWKIEIAAIAAILGAEFTASISVAGTRIASNEVRNPVAALSQPRSVLVGVSGYRLTAGALVTFGASQNSGSGAVTLTGTAIRNFVSIAASR